MTTHTDDSLGSIPAGEAGEPVAWLVHGGRHYVDRAFISRNFAEQSVDERRDGAVISPLYLAPSLAPAAAVRMLTDERINVLCAEHSGNYSGDCTCEWVDATALARAIEREFCAVNGLTLGAAAPVGSETTQAAKDVLAERRRQIEVEGWDAAHDDEHEGGSGSLAKAAACYALAASEQASGWDGPFVKQPGLWPWEAQWWKPKDQRRNLVRAAALLLAEIERLDRKDSRHA